MAKIKKISCENAEKLLRDLLPTREQMKHVWEDSFNQVPEDERQLIYWDETDVHAWLPIPGKYQWEATSYWHLLQRSFLGSCSSSWSWGLWRAPNLPLSHRDRIYAGGPADTIEEAGYARLKQAIQACLLRHRTGIAQSAGVLRIMVVELANCYRGGWEISERSLGGLQSLHTLRKELRQPGYQAVSLVDDRLVILHDTQYLKYLWERLAEFHQSNPINVGLSCGHLYYLSQDHLVSDAINRLWLGMKCLTPGSIVYDLQRLGWFNGAYPVGLAPEEAGDYKAVPMAPLYGFHPEIPGSARTQHGIDFGYGHLEPPKAPE